MKKKNTVKSCSFLDGRRASGGFRPALPCRQSRVLGLTVNLAFELAPLNIYVNCIVPGPIETPFWDALQPPGPERDAFFAALCKKEVPLGRMGKPEDIAGPALFLASGLSDYVTGQIIYAAGGQPLLCACGHLPIGAPGIKRFTVI